MCINNFIKSFSSFKNFTTIEIIICGLFLLTTSCGRRERPLPGSHPNNSNAIENQSLQTANPQKAEGNRNNTSKKSSENESSNTRNSSSDSNSSPSNTVDRSSSTSKSEENGSTHISSNKAVQNKPENANNSDSSTGKVPLTPIQEVIEYLNGIRGQKNSPKIKVTIEEKINDLIGKNSAQFSSDNYDPELLKLMIERLPEDKPKKLDGYIGPIKLVVVQLGKENKEALKGVADLVIARSRTAYKDVVNLVKHYCKA